MPVYRATVTSLLARIGAAVGIGAVLAGWAPSALVGAPVAQAQAVSLPWPVSPWVASHAASARLIGGEREVAASRLLLAGIEIKLAAGWKTYWRHPGDNGGVPPAFDWTGSENLVSARVLYPVPHLITDPNGVSIGYKTGVVFPVEVTPADPSRPVLLRLQLEYGICREICVPAEASLALSLPVDLHAMPPDLATALGHVPHAAGARAVGDPALKSAAATLSGKTPSLRFEITTGNAGADAELFVEAPDGLYLPLAKKSGAASGGVQTYSIDLTGVDDLPKLAGKLLLLTIASPNGGAEASWVVR